MTEEPRFTILLPVSQHSGVLPATVASVTRQSHHELELFIICIGVPSSTRAWAEKEAAKDSRVRVFDFPKAEHLGEPYLAAALAEATGELVAHIGDDYLWLPGFLMELRGLLGRVDFGNLVETIVDRSGAMTPVVADLADPAVRLAMMEGNRAFFGPGSAGYRLSAYRSLAEGWSPPPAGVFSHLHMWRRFLADARFTVGTRFVAESLHLPAGRRREFDLRQVEADYLALAKRIGNRGSRVELRQSLMRQIHRRIADRSAWACLPGASAYQRGIEVCGFFTLPTGMGESARRSAAALATAGVPVATHDVTPESWPEERLPFHPAGDSAAAFDTALMHLNPDNLFRVLEKARFLDRLSGRRRIAFIHWELPVFPPSWIDALAILDEVWAPSRFVADALTAASNIPVRIVPHPAIVTPYSRDEARARLGWPQDRRIILSVFDASSTPARKNPGAVLRAYQDAFPRSDADAPLLVFKYQRKLPTHDLADLIAADNGKNIRIIDQTVPADHMLLLYAACDAVVSLHRSEGYGLNLLDSMAAGKPCVATAFSGNLDFMSPENSILIPYAMRAVGAGEYWNGQGQWWAEPDHDASVEALRRLGRASDAELTEIGSRARADVMTANSFERVGQIARAVWSGVKVPG